MHTHVYIHSREGAAGKAGKDYDPADTTTLTLGVVRDPVFALGVTVNPNPGARIMGPTGAEEEREIMVGGIGLHQFASTYCDGHGSVHLY